MVEACILAAAWGAGSADVAAADLHSVQWLLIINGGNAASEPFSKNLLSFSAKLSVGAWNFRIWFHRNETWPSPVTGRVGDTDISSPSRFYHGSCSERPSK